MAIENRNLAVGTKLVATYKKQAFVCVVEAAEGSNGVVFALEDGKKYSSVSAAGAAVMGRKTVNGWRFWSVEGERAVGYEKKAGRTADPVGKKLIFRAPNQKGVEEGQVRGFCSACMKSFYADDQQPEVCREGHRIDDPQFT